jgi:hypothetical protein
MTLSVFNDYLNKYTKDYGCLVLEIETGNLYHYKSKLIT